MWSILPSIVLGCKGQGLTNLFYLILQEIPGKEEYKAVTKILKTQTELLQVGDQEYPWHLSWMPEQLLIQTISSGTLFSAAKF